MIAWSAEVELQRSGRPTVEQSLGAAAVCSAPSRGKAGDCGMEEGRGRLG